MDKKNKNPNVPNLRYYHSDKLSKVKLGNICSITGGYAFDSRKMKSKGEYQIIKMGNLYNGVLDLTRNPSFIDNPTKKELEYLIHKNDILITLTGTVNKKDYGYTVQLNNPNNLLLNQRCALIKPLNINEKYLFYLLNSNNFFKQFYASSTGGTGNQTNVSINDMLNFNMYIANEKNQIIISEFLNKIDQRIETQIKIIDDYSSVKDYIIKQCFQKCKEYINLGNLFKYGKAGGTPKSTIKEFYDGNIPFMGISDITNQGKYISYTSKNITQKGLINSSAWLVPKNSLILSMYASVGLPAINKIPLATSQAMMSMIFDNDLDVEFVYYYLCYFKKSKIQSLLETGTQSNINADTVKSIKVPKLRADEKEKITNIFIKVDQLINNEKEILNSLQKQKNFLLKNMFV